MANTTAGALKTVIEGLGLGISAYRDRAPQGKARPYVTIMEDVSAVPDQLEDGAVSTGVELAQVDLWQTWRNSDKSLAENTALINGLVVGLHGADLGVIGSGPGRRAYKALVRNSRRLPELDNNIVHHAIDVDVVRQF